MRNEDLNQPTPPGVVAFLSPKRPQITNPFLSESITVTDFVATCFVPDHIAEKTIPGQRHYQAILKHVLAPVDVERAFGAVLEASRTRLEPRPEWPYLGDIPLCDVKPEHVQNIITTAGRAGYSTQTIRHIRNVIGAIFTHATKLHLARGMNPAADIAMPGMVRRESHFLTLAEVVRVLQLMHYPEREVTLFALLTDMNIAEICGLKWQYVNLADSPATCEDETIPANSLLVRTQWYRGGLCPVPAGRRKAIALPQLLHSLLSALHRARTQSWNEYVLCSRAGRPVNQINLAARRLKIIGLEMGIPWLSWQVLRRTRVALFHEFGLQFQHELARALPGSSRRHPHILPSYLERTSF